MQHINQHGLDIIKHYEGFSQIPYLCPAGYLTIGYGHRVKNSEQFLKPLTPLDAEMLLKGDVTIAEQAIQKYVHIPLNDNQFSALTSFVFNVGIGAFTSSTLLTYINAGKHQAVPSELIRWVWATGHKLPGLVKRRKEEGKLYST